MAKIELNNLSSGYNINTINVNFGKIETEFKDKVVYRNEASPMARDLDVNGYGVINLRNPVNNGDAVSYGFLLNSDAFSFTGLEYKGAWANNVTYLKNNYVTVDGLVYISQESHISSPSFATDLSAGKWVAFSSGGGDLVSTNNLSDLASFSTARSNLNVPSRTGDGASGNWNINAATATLATLATNATNADNADTADFATTAGSFSGIQPISNGGTGESTAANAFAALKQPASTTATGVVELATNAEVEAGTDTTRAVAPAGVEAHMVANALGWGQTWQNVLGSRSSGVTYTNSTGRPIMVSAGQAGSGAAVVLTAVVAGVTVANISTAGGGQGSNTAYFVVPAGATYSITLSAPFSFWSELR